MVAFQLVLPRRCPNPRRIRRPASLHLRAFYQRPGSGGRQRHHLAVVAIPASEADGEAFIERCLQRAAKYGASEAERAHIAARIGKRLLRVNMEQAEDGAATDEARSHLRMAARALARLSIRRGR